MCVDMPHAEALDESCKRRGLDEDEDASQRPSCGAAIAAGDDAHECPDVEAWPPHEEVEVAEKRLRAEERNEMHVRRCLGRQRVDDLRLLDEERGQLGPEAPPHARPLGQDECLAQHRKAR